MEAHSRRINGSGVSNEAESSDTSSLTSLDYYDNGDEWATAAAAVTEAATVPTVSSENTHELFAGLVNENLREGIPLDEIIVMPRKDDWPVILSNPIFNANVTLFSFSKQSFTSTSSL